MLEVNMIGGGFQHEICSTAGSRPNHIKWVKDGSAKVSMYIDYDMRGPVMKSTKNYAWLCEAKTINPMLYNWVSQNIEYLEHKFEAIFTHDRELLVLSPIFKYVISNNRPWITKPAIYPKSRLLSMIASDKVMCEAHVLRQQFIRLHRDSLDLYGHGYNPIPDKLDGLKNYYFSVAMENGQYPKMYTEKLTDCFACGTIPLYWGDKSVLEDFNPKGIIFHDNMDITELTPELYQDRIEAVTENFIIAMNIPCSEDYIFKHYLQ